jgi:transcriptional regulator with XRE-family HTH domain
MATREETFGDWLLQQIEVLGWRQVDLARRMDVSRSTVCDLVNSRRLPSTDVCVRIAGALSIPPEDVLRLAGHLPPDAVELEDLSLRQLVEVARQLTESDRAELLEIAFLKLRRRDRPGASLSPRPADTVTPA